MKTNFALVLLSFACALVSANREDTMKVFEKVDVVLPKYKEQQDKVIEAIAEVKYDMSRVTNKFQTVVLKAKEDATVKQVEKEKTALSLISKQSADADGSCLINLKNIIEKQMNLNGHGFSICLGRANRILTSASADLYKKLQMDESGFAGVGILDAFDKQNIFEHAEKIMTNLDTKLEELGNAPNVITEEVKEAMEVFENTLSDTTAIFEACVITQEELSSRQFMLMNDQLEKTCEGDITL